MEEPSHTETHRRTNGLTARPGLVQTAIGLDTTTAKLNVHAVDRLGMCIWGRSG